MRLVVAQGHKVWLQNRLVVGAIPTLGNEIFIKIYIFISSLWCRVKNVALTSATQHKMPPDFGGKWGMECFNSRFSLSTLLCAGYSVKVKKREKIKFIKLRVTIFLTLINVNYNELKTFGKCKRLPNWHSIITLSIRNNLVPLDFNFGRHNLTTTWV